MAVKTAARNTPDAFSARHDEGLPLRQKFRVHPLTEEQKRRAMRKVALDVPKTDVKLVLQRLGLIPW